MEALTAPGADARRLPRVRLRRLHGRGQVHGRARRGGGAGRRAAGLRPRARAAPRRGDRELLRPRGRGRLPRARGRGGARPARASGHARRSRSAAARSAPSACATRCAATRSSTSRSASDEAWRRASGKGRPLARDRDQFEQLKHDREAVYEALASVSLPPMPRDGMRRAMRVLDGARDGPGRARGSLWAASASGEYPVFFGRGLVGAGFFHPADGRRFVVTDENVGQVLPLESHATYAFPPGEQEKTLERAEDVLRFLARRRRHARRHRRGAGRRCGRRPGRLLRVGLPARHALGRDPDHARRPGRLGLRREDRRRPARRRRTTSAPTTSPAAVLVDPSLLETLPPEEAAAGYAEVVKTALIAGGPLWARVREGGPVDDETIWRCLRTKLAVVAEDERDGGRRQVLNLGHTVGHAIEAATGYGRYRHGEAIAIGLLAALRLSGRDALRNEVAGLLAARGLPAKFEGAAVDDVLEYLARDKKRAGGRVPFVLVRGARRGDARARRRRRRAARGGRGGRGVNTRIAVMHGVNLDQLGRRDPEHYPRDHADGARGAGEAVGAGARARAVVLPDELTRASSARSCTRSARRRTASCSTRARGRTTRGRSATRSRSPACRPSRSTSRPSTSARSGGASR